MTPNPAAPTSSRRVVVTGLGATTPLGGTVPATWQAALEGTSGARTLGYDWVAQHQLPVTFGAPLAVPAAEVLAKVETRRLDPSGQYALIAAREAWADAGAPEVDGDRLGVVVASGIGGVWTLLSSYDTLKEKGPRRVFPLTVPMLMPNGPAAAVSLELGARAGVHTPVSACASGAEAMAYGAEMIRTGRADIVVAGGTEAAIHALPIAGFAAMQALSTRNDEPQLASRPYDTGRDGFVLGEGAGLVVLESEEHARARGARIYAELAGAGLSSDALLGAAGAVEGIFTILALHHRVAPPTINLDNLDPEVNLDVVVDKPRQLPEGELVALNNSFGFGGHNVALAIRSAS
jgi:3-oxoacyl-[acyl-carrier-protein] synthase II